MGLTLRPACYKNVLEDQIPKTRPSNQVIVEIYKSLFTFRDELIVDRNSIEVSTESTSAIDIIAVQLHLKHSKTLEQHLATLTTIVLFESK